MAAILDLMPKPPTKKDRKVFPSREKVSYAAIPKEYAALLKELSADGERYEGRSVSYLTRIAVRAFLKLEGKLDDKGKPVA